ncbi:hypothetical protein [Vreelandella sp. EE27]
MVKPLAQRLGSGGSQDTATVNSVAVFSFFISSFYLFMDLGSDEMQFDQFNQSLSPLCF